jgi:hypothetical protein
MDPNNKKKNPFDEEADDFIEPFEVTSTQDCTGLIPASPATDDEADAYTELHDIPDVKKKDAK